MLLPPHPPYAPSPLCYSPPLFAPAASLTYTYTFQLDGESTINSPLGSSRFRSELQRAVLAGTVEAWSEGPDMADTLGALRLAHVEVGGICSRRGRGGGEGGAVWRRGGGERGVEAWSEGPDMADTLGALRLAHVEVGASSLGRERCIRVQRGLGAVQLAHPGGEGGIAGTGTVVAWSEGPDMADTLGALRLATCVEAGTGRLGWALVD